MARMTLAQVAALSVRIELQLNCRLVEGNLGNGRSTGWLSVHRLAPGGGVLVQQYPAATPVFVPKVLAEQVVVEVEDA